MQAGSRSFSQTALACAALAAALTAASPAAWPQATGSVKSVTATLGGSDARKECINLAASQRLRYWYRADAVVNFNVQHVQGKETLYVVRKDKALMSSGEFRPKTANVYCMVWTNLNRQAVTLSFEFGRLGGG